MLKRLQNKLSFQRCVFLLFALIGESLLEKKWQCSEPELLWNVVSHKISELTIAFSKLGLHSLQCRRQDYAKFGNDDDEGSKEGEGEVGGERDDAMMEQEVAIVTRISVYLVSISFVFPFTLLDIKLAPRSKVIYYTMRRLKGSKRSAPRLGRKVKIPSSCDGLPFEPVISQKDAFLLTGKTIICFALKES